MPGESAAVVAGLLIARLALAVVFFLAAAAKLADRAGTLAAITGFGVSRFLATPLGVALPVAELAVAGALLPARTSSWGAAGALVLLGLFGAGIIMLIVRGGRADCRCFGQLHSSPMGWPTLGRNIVLAGIAGFVLIGARGQAAPSYLDLVDGFRAAEWAALTMAVFAVTVLAAGITFGIHLMRQHGRILLRLDALEQELFKRGLISPSSSREAPAPKGLPIGTPAPAFETANLRGGSTSLGALLAAGHPVLLVFAQPGCAPCTALVPEIALWQEAHRAEFSIGLVSQGTLEANRARFGGAGIEQVLVQRAGEIEDQFGVHLTPSAVLISNDGAIASPVAQGAVAIRSLVGSVVTRYRLPGGHRQGGPTARDRRATSPHQVSVDAR